MPNKKEKYNLKSRIFLPFLCFYGSSRQMTSPMEGKYDRMTYHEKKRYSRFSFMEKICQKLRRDFATQSATSR